MLVMDLKWSNRPILLQYECSRNVRMLHSLPDLTDEPFGKLQAGNECTEKHNNSVT